MRLRLVAFSISQTLSVPLCSTRVFPQTIPHVRFVLNILTKYENYVKIKLAPARHAQAASRGNRMYIGQKQKEETML